MEGSDSELSVSIRDDDHEEQSQGDQDHFDMSRNYSQMSEDEDHQVMHQRQQNYTEEEEDDESENQDHVNEMSFNQQVQYDQEESEGEGNGEDEEEEEDEDDENDADMGEMKAKFDKIMQNFKEEQKGKVSNANSGQAADINDYKIKNLQNNAKAIFQNILKQQNISEQEEEEEQTDAVVEGPDTDNNEQSVNIRINNKKLFPDMPKTKPPIPQKVQIKDQQEQRASTPDREQGLRENIRNRLERNNQKSSGVQRPKSAKAVPQKQTLVQRSRPMTAKYVENKENDNTGTQQKKPFVPRQLNRPMTAMPSSSKASLIKKPKNNKKKSDPVSRYQNLSNEWQKNKFIKGNLNKEGRKLDLDRFHKWSTLVQAHNAHTTVKKGQVHKFISNGKAPTEDRRDDLRFQLRAKISQTNYVNKDMKYFHYQQDMKTPLQNALKDPEVGEAAIKLEQLKKQINHLRKCVE